jgi:hypothetical protein
MRPLPLRAPSAFNGSCKTLTLLLFLPLMLRCCAATVKAEPVVIQGGASGTSLGNGNIFLGMTAPNFSFSAANTSAPKTQLCGLCNPGSVFGGTYLASNNLTIELIYNGVIYKQNTLGPYVVSGGGSFTFGLLTVPDDLSPVSTTFSFIGGVNASTFNGEPVLRLELIGAGTVTFTFVQSGSNIRSQAVFAFEPLATPVPTPTPEPATLLLLGTGLAGVVAKVRRRRQKA